MLKKGLNEEVISGGNETYRFNYCYGFHKYTPETNFLGSDFSLPIFAQDIQTFIQLAAENLIIYFLNIYLIYIFERVTKSKREREKGDYPSAGSYP